MVLFADRYATACKHQVVRYGSIAQGRHGIVEPIRHDAQVGHFAAQPCQQGTKKETVGVVDGARPHGLGGNAAGHDELVTGGEQGDAWAPRHVERRHANAGHQTAGSRREPVALQHNRCAPCYVLACATHVLTGARHGVESNPRAVVQRRRFLLHHDGIGAGRQRCTGEDARSRASLQRRAVAAGRDALRHAQDRAPGRHIRCTHRIAVHRAVVMRRNVQRRDGIGGQDSPIGIEGRNRLAAQRRMRVRQQLGQRVVQRAQGAACCIGTGRIRCDGDVWHEEPESVVRLDVVVKALGVVEQPARRALGVIQRQQRQ